MKKASTFNYTQTTNDFYFDILPQNNFTPTPKQLKKLEKRIPEFLQDYKKLYGESVSFHFTFEGDEFKAVADHHFAVMVESMDPKTWSVYLLLEKE